jgi:hypothetical protein
VQEVKKPEVKKPQTTRMVATGVMGKVPGQGPPPKKRGRPPTKGKQQSKKSINFIHKNLQK